MPRITSENLTPAARRIWGRWQRNALALRQEMGFPLTSMANESVKWAASEAADHERSIEIARIAATLGRDLIFQGYYNSKAKDPARVSLAYRDDALINWRPQLEVWAADYSAPVILIDLERGERYELGERNTLVRRAGLPAGDLARGKRIAHARLRRTAMTMTEEPVAGGFSVPHGAEVAAHMPTIADAAVRLA